jgi:putative oxidoreductase
MRLKTVLSFYAQALSLLIHPVLLLIRLLLAKIFFFSGLTKIEDFDSTMLLFENEYQVPLLPIWLAAGSATFLELSMPVLLVLGLGTRLAVVPLLVMVGVIEFTYQSHSEHIYWTLLLAVLLARGSGFLSFDALVDCFFNKKVKATA